MKKVTMIFSLATGFALAQSPQIQLEPKGDALIVRDNPTYSTDVMAHRPADGLLWSREADLAKADADLAAHRPDAAHVRFLILPGVAQAALEAGSNEKAEKYAREALALAAKSKKPTVILPGGDPISNVAEAVFKGNMVLGRLALMNGDIESAKNYLLLAGKTDGDPVLDTFGPNMSLARELLKASQPDTVIEFLEECKVFWKSERGRIERWIGDIQAGRMPEFGPNLIYN